MRIGSLLLPLLALGCAAVAPTDEGDDLVTGEAQLTFERPEVGIVYWNGAACTGTLIRDNVVLTAAHCVGFGADDGRGAALGNFILFIDDAHHHQYAFDAYVSFGNDLDVASTPAHDVALLRLTERVAPEVAQPAALAVRKPSADEGVSLFGFGCTATQPADQGKKQKVSFFPDQTADLCPGDAGGPTFLADGALFQINSAYDSEVGAFGDVVLHRANLEAQAQAWAASEQQVGADAPEQDLTCDGLRGCVDGCGGDVACRQACAARTAPTPRRLYDALTACSQANRCPDFGCVELACGDQIRACTGALAGEPGVAQPPAGGLSCPELLGCAQQCGVDAACMEACRGRASDAAIDAYDGYAGCFHANACQDGDCASAHCAAEYAQCSGPAEAPDVADPNRGGPDGGGPDGGEPPADDGQSPPDQGSDLPETDPGPPLADEGGQSEPPPPELTCNEVLQCIESCNDPSCQQDCFRQGRLLAQAAYSALAVCGTLHLCGNAACLQLHCAAQYETCTTGRYVPPPPRSGGGGRRNRGGGPGDPCGC